MINSLLFLTFHFILLTHSTSSFAYVIEQEHFLPQKRLINYYFSDFCFKISDLATKSSFIFHFDNKNFDYIQHHKKIFITLQLDQLLKFMPHQKNNPNLLKENFKIKTVSQHKNQQDIVVKKIEFYQQDKIVAVVTMADNVLLSPIKDLWENFQQNDFLELFPSLLKNPSVAYGFPLFFELIEESQRHTYIKTKKILKINHTNKHCQIPSYYHSIFDDRKNSNQK